MTALEIPAPIVEFKALLLKAKPQAEISLDLPANDAGVWWIDVRLNSLLMPTMWTKDRGFGLYTELEAGYGERPNELHRTADTASKRFLQIAEDIARERFAGLTLPNLRQLTGINQTEFAKRIGVEQSTVSRFENRSNVEVDTLRRAVEALGGRLVMSVRMPTFEGEFLSSGGSTRAMEGCISDTLVMPEEKPLQSTKKAHRSSKKPRRSATSQGTVRWFNGQKGYGFIQPEDGGDDVFVHITAVERAGMGMLREGQKVGFDIRQDRNTGKLSIETIRELGTHKSRTK